MKYYLILFFACSLVFCGCKKKEETPMVGEYVYIDHHECIHVDRKCLQLMISDDSNGGSNYMVKRIKVEELDSIGNTCSFCVTDELYKQMESKVYHK